MPFSKKFLEKKFDFLYKTADAAMADVNPCAIKNGSCHSMRKFPEEHVNDPFCCKGCQYLGKNGCTVKSLYCKVWLCETAENNIKRRSISHALIKLDRVKKVALCYNLLVLRGSKEDSIKQALSKRISVSDVFDPDRVEAPV